MATGLLKSRAFVRFEWALEGYTWDVMVARVCWCRSGRGSPIVLVQQYGLFELGSDKELSVVQSRFLVTFFPPLEGIWEKSKNVVRRRRLATLTPEWATVPVTCDSLDQHFENIA